MKLHTIGYEGLDLESFAQLLEQNKVRRIIDIREIPISRKPGFSKTKLNEFLQSIGIDYIHIPALGCPKNIRHDYRVDKNWARYTTRYLIHMLSLDRELLDLQSCVEQGQSCLLCFEADHYRCHRSFIASHLERESLGNIVIEPIMIHQTNKVEWLSSVLV